MSGWVPMPADVWAQVVEHLPQPWTEEQARFDLRWQVDQLGVMMGRGTLAKRWGWTPDEVRTELRHPERWWDPLRGPLPASRDDLTRQPPGLTRRDQGTPRSVQSNADKSDGLTSADQATPRSDQATPQRVDPPSPPPSPSPPQGTQTDVAPTPQPDPVPPAESVSRAQRREDFDQLLLAWNTEVVPAARKRGGTASPHERLQASTGLGKAVRQRLDQHGLDSCLSVIRWFGSSDHPRAEFLRSGGHELSTLMRPSKFEEYAGFATAPTPLRGRHAHDPPQQARPPPPPMGPDELKALQAKAEREYAELRARETAPRRRETREPTR